MPISDCDVRDPRIRRTRQLLQGALRTLLQGKSFDQISVQDITDQATVNRATFYDHYTDKYGLLEAMVAGGFHELLSERNVSYDGTCPSAARAVILATCDFRTHCEARGPIGQDQGAFESLIDAAIVRTIRRVLMQGIHASPGDSSGSAELRAAGVSWAIYGAVKEWSLTPNRCAASEIVPVILELVMPILQAALQSDGAIRAEA